LPTRQQAAVAPDFCLVRHREISFQVFPDVLLVAAHIYLTFL